MTQLPELRKHLIEAHVKSDAAKPFVEVRVGRRLMAVTIECRNVATCDVDLTVTRATVRLVSRRDPDLLNVVVALPMTAEPGRYWARFNHGVCDILVLRATRSD